MAFQLIVLVALTSQLYMLDDTFRRSASASVGQQDVAAPAYRAASASQAKHEALAANREL